MRTFLAVLVGLVVGNIVNMGLITVGPSIIAPPEGVDPTDIESIKANLHLYGPKHWVMPWLAHALGTLAGAFVAVRIAVRNRAIAAYVIAALFLLGGIAMAVMLDAPLWFEAVDLIGAYLPMAWLATKLGGGAEPADEG